MPEDSLYQSLWPDMMKATRMLLVDYDVCRYHSFDLLRYRLFCSKEFLSHIKKDYYYFIDTDVDLGLRLYLMKTTFPHLNIFNAFNMDCGVDTPDKLEDAVNAMIADNAAKYTSTDIAIKFDAVFRYQNITGFLLRHPYDKVRLCYWDQLTVFEDQHVLNPELIAAIVKANRINAVLCCSIDTAVSVASILQLDGYRDHMTFIIASYGYNYVWDEDGNRLYPRRLNDIRIMQGSLGHEVGFFDPFSGLTENVGIIADMDEEDRMKKQAESEGVFEK